MSSSLQEPEQAVAAGKDTGRGILPYSVAHNHTFAAVTLLVHMCQEVCGNNIVGIDYTARIEFPLVFSKKPVKKPIQRIALRLMCRIISFVDMAAHSEGDCRGLVRTVVGNHENLEVCLRIGHFA